MKVQRGFTLIELLIVIVLIAIILAMATLNFKRLNDKYRVESETQEIYSILTKARNNAANGNITYLVSLSANQLQVGADANNDGIMDSSETIAFTRFPITFTNSAIAFDRRGGTSIFNNTISINGYSSGTSPAMDCILVSVTRINIGLMNGETCVEK